MRWSRSLDRASRRGVARASPIGRRARAASRVEIHERRIAAEQVDAEIARFEQALAETDAQLARIQAQIAEREGDEHQYRILEAHRLMLSDVHLVERARRMIREDKTVGRVGGAQGARPDPGGVRAHRGPVLPRPQERRRPGRRAPAAQPGGDRRLGVGRGGAQGEHRRRRTSCRPPTPRSWGARRRPASAPRGAGARRTPRSWRARWGCPTWCGVEGLGAQASGPG